ncbi:MAG: hypothetical protein HXX20_21460 [Chloroflexi bacterium]|nr:hypothetical protein [Chloroflexota bacterium]
MTMIQIDTRVIKDRVWYVAFNDERGQLNSPYHEDHSVPKIAAAQPFTVTLNTVWISGKPDQSMLHWLLHPNTDVVIKSTTVLGTHPEVQRIHYYQDSVPIHQTLTGFLAQTMFVCDDYSGNDNLALKLQVLMVDDSSKQDGLVTSFSGLVNGSGAIFPAILPYTMIAVGLSKTVEQFIKGTDETKPLLECSINFKPAGHGCPILREGTYVVFDREVEAGDYILIDNNRLVSSDGQDITIDATYAIFTIEIGNAPSPEFVVSQRVATLLTQLDKGGNDPSKTSIEFVTETLQLYSHFKDLQRYADLKAESAKRSLTVPEQALIERLGQREELQPFLPR